MKNYDTQCIIDRYQEKPVSISKIAKEFNLCEVTVSRLLKKEDIPMWTRQDLNIGELKTNYFREIDTENKAYLLGLFTADECVYSVNQSKAFTIQLKKDDVEMIQFIKNELSIPRKIVTDKRDGSYGISIVNNLFVQHLIEHGVTEGKSTRFRPTLPDYLMSHYIRGLFDGDGSVVIRKVHTYGKAMRCCVVILAHSNIINPLREYKGANLYLKRKHCKYLEALSYLS